MDSKGKTYYDIFTKTQDGQIVSRQTLQDLKGNKFITEVEQNKKDAELVDILTKNENTDVISKITLRPIFQTIQNEDYLKEFELNKKKTTVIKVHQEDENTIRQQMLRPTKIGNQVYQQYINEIIDQ